LSTVEAAVSTVCRKVAAAGRGFPADRRKSSCPAPVVDNTQLAANDRLRKVIWCADLMFPRRIVMRNFRLVQVSACLVMLVLFVCGQESVAQEKYHPHVSLKVVPRDRAENSAANPEAAPPLNLYPLQAAFTQTYPTIGANADGTDIWPCTGNSSSTGPNPDCSTIGDPAITFPSNATAIGNPAFVWQLKNIAGWGNGQGCNALINGTGHLGVPYLPCGQAETWYEDDSNDSTDDLLYTMVVRQGDRTIYDSGTVDIGINANGGQTPPVDQIIYNPINFGYGPGDGPGTGPNNGNCVADYNYPLTSPANPGAEYLVEAGKTCVAPVAGWATITVTTALGTPEYTKVMGAECTSHGVASPCYTVKWSRKYQISQTWDIFLE
jgi:hypothetical protein